MTSSVNSLASDSTISTASPVPATTRSSSLSAISSISGLSTYSPLMKPTRAAPIGPMKGAPDKRQRGGGGDQREDVRIVLHVMGERGDDHLGLVAPAVGEQRTDRAVDQAGDQRLLFGRTAFALEIAARNAAGGIEFFLIIDGERQEIDAFARRLGRDHGREHGGFAIGGNDGAVGLARDFAGLEDELAPAPVEFNAVFIEHFAFLSSVFGLREEPWARRRDAAGRGIHRAQATASGDPAMAHPSGMRTDQSVVDVRSGSGRFAAGRNADATLRPLIRA